VVVPSDDWAAPADDVPELAPARLLAATAADPDAVAELAALVAASSDPVIVVGADADTPQTWAALVELAERLGCPVWQEVFSARAGFPQDHPQFAGILPAGRGRLRAALARHDLVLVIGAPVFTQYPYEPGPLVAEGTAVVLVTDDHEDAHHSPVDLAVVAPLEPVCAALAAAIPARGRAYERPAAAGAPVAADDEPLRAVHVLGALAARIPPETVVVEETPSSRPDLHRLVPARQSLGFLSAAMGGLGFALPAAIGLRMAQPRRPVVAVIGDGSSLYAIQALWTAAHYRVGVLVVVLANGRYAVMDRLAEQHGSGKPAWPAFTEVSVHGLARALGCPAQRVESAVELEAVLDAVVPTLGERAEPLLIEAAVRVEPTFEA
jgi:thiamine pyrophosphate-dependent acetolactate synthase large subunit-like protein